MLIIFTKPITCYIYSYSYLLIVTAISSHHRFYNNNNNLFIYVTGGLQYLPKILLISILIDLSVFLDLNSTITVTEQAIMRVDIRSLALLSANYKHYLYLK